ncbi:kynurenine 3-monooxygenase [Kordia periserrulae]|uniref:Kynurenine 3-monooxygenase n=1 Tax=Kordia periserrulae TaxID=701523 RepID=A0A2T6C5C0_9FLAO|nr:NAD(P)/FAD-dependent oxidoreductase [Kordia periserrulae]PTX63511.1 kynurenine 3-monooxygenase [Kordia periserrulae]
MEKKENILIIGAGLCGSLLALRLGQRGYKVTVMESRPDLRKVDISAGRSINLAFSDRGIKAMNMVGIADKVMPLCIPMHGRLVHDVEGNTFMSNYSGREGEYINSISRGDLNALLLTEAEEHEAVNIHFNKKCTGVDIENNVASFYCYETEKDIEFTADVIFGADGAGSALRKSYYLERKFLFSYSQNYLTHGYKELSIPPTATGGFRTEKNALHIWPRGDYMIIALPNLDGSFTVTLFLSYDEGEYNFNNITTPERVQEFFEAQFPDLLPLIPDLKKEYFENPTAPLGTVKCSPWSYKNNTLLMGDAAHAIVPFYGQGMNASFEDVVVLNEVLDTHEGDWEAVFKAYEKTRKKDTDAIADLAIDNYYEMRDHVANPIFKEKRKLEMDLEKNFPEQYFSKYSMVTFNEDIPYSKAMQIGRAQDKALLNMIADDEIDTTEDLHAILKKVQEETNEILEEDSVAKMKH